MESSSFEKFIKGCLVSQGYVSGVAMLSRHGQVLYSHGQLKNITQAEVSQFQTLFGSGTRPVQSSCNTDFMIKSPTGNQAVYKAYQKNYSSLYATSSKDSGGLTVCNLPYGVLVCTYSADTRAGEAIKSIEAFCDLMRR